MFAAFNNIVETQVKNNLALAEKRFYNIGFQQFLKKFSEKSQKVVEGVSKPLNASESVTDHAPNVYGDGGGGGATRPLPRDGSVEEPMETQRVRMYISFIYVQLFLDTCETLNLIKINTANNCLSSIYFMILRWSLWGFAIT